MTEHHSSRRARAMNKDRSRQQALRNRRKAAKAPSTHTLNRAITYAFMVELRARRESGAKVSNAQVSAAGVFRAALEYLTAGTHGGNSYATAEVHKALVARVWRNAPAPD